MSNIILLFHALSAHLQPRGDPTSWTSSPPSWGCSSRRAWWPLVNIWRRERTPKGLQPLQAWGVALPHPAMAVEVVRVWAGHCHTHQLQGSCTGSERDNPPWSRHEEHAEQIPHCLLNKEIKKKIKPEFICIKSKSFELCINRRRFWLAFPKEALISFVKWGNGCAALHEGVYKWWKWGICCMQKAKGPTAANPHSQGEFP